MADENSANAVDLAASLTVAWLSNPNVRANGEEVVAFLQNIHSTLASLSQPASPEKQEAAPVEGEFAPAVSVRQSLASRDKLISLIDGKPYKTLKRHLSSHGLTPAQYRDRYGLKTDYPMVAPAYAEKRRALAKKIGLGRKAGAGRKPAAAKATKPAARRRGRPPKAS